MTVVQCWLYFDLFRKIYMEDQEDKVLSRFYENKIFDWNNRNSSYLWIKKIK